MPSEAPVMTAQLPLGPNLESCEIGQFLATCPLHASYGYSGQDEETG